MTSLRKQPVLLGAIAGDVIGAPFEHHSTKSMQFPLFSHYSHFTDDSVLTIAVAEAILKGGDYRKYVLHYARKFPHAGYGGAFRQWIYETDPEPYNSFGNGSAMRVSPVAWAFEDEDEVMEQARASAAITHSHPEGIKGAQAIALAVFLARKGGSKPEIRREIMQRFGYDLIPAYDDIQPGYEWDVTCQGTVPAALISFLDSEDYEDCVRRAIALGGDADTLAAIAGSVAEAFYGEVPERIGNQVLALLPADLLAVVARFNDRYAG